MGQYVGLDVSLEETKVHVLDEQGKPVWRGACVRGVSSDWGSGRHGQL